MGYGNGFGVLSHCVSAGREGVGSRGLRCIGTLGTLKLHSRRDLGAGFVVWVSVYFLKGAGCLILYWGFCEISVHFWAFGGGIIVGM